MNRGVLLFGLFVALRSAAQYPFTRTFDLRLGQQRPHIQCVAQDGQGSLWAGSDMGVLRSDGERTILVMGSDGSAVTGITPTSTGMAVVLADGRIVRFRGRRVISEITDTLMARFPARSLYSDHDDRLWAGLYGAGVLLHDEGSVKHISSANGLPDDHVHAIAPFNGDHVAIATDLGIAVCNDAGTVVRTIGESDGSPDNLVTALHTDGKGGLWAGSDRGGVFHIDEQGNVTRPTDHWTYGAVASIAFAADLLFIATMDHGMQVLSTENGTATYSPTSANRNGPRARQAITLADGSVLWCDGSEVLHRSDPNVLVAPVHEQLDLTNITAICSDDTGRIWLATKAGVFGHYAGFPDGERLERLPLEVPATSPIVSLHADRHGHLWAGTFGSGVYRIRLSTGKVDHFTMAQGSGNDNVLAIAEDPTPGASTMWCATLAGLTSFAGVEESDHRMPQAFPTPGTGFLYDVEPWSGKGILAATDGDGILFVPKVGGPELLHHDSLRTVYSLCSDGKGDVWAVGPGTGLCRVSTSAGAGFRRFAMGKAPFDGEMFCIAWFAEHLIALGQGGLAAFDPQRERLIDLTQEFGLAGVGAELNVACTDPFGALWLGTDKGLVRFRAAPGILDAEVRTVITDMSWGDEQLPVEGALSLRHDQNFITFGFAGVRYSSPEHVRFEYRLAGFDDRIRTTRDRLVTWSRLPPGEYRFEVRAATGHNDMPEAWTGLSFTIKQPWWRQWWALLSALVLALLVVLLLVRARDNRMRYRDRMEKEKARFQLEALRSQVNPHFLFNSFNTLIGLIEEDRSKAVEHTEQLSDFFRNILQVREKELIPLSEELPLLHTYFSLEKRRFGDRIDLRTDIARDQLDQLIPPLTLQLLVENAIKHNTATVDQPLVVEVGSSNGALFVRNPYRPRATASAGTGYGLESIRQRYQMLTDRPVQLELTEHTFEVRIPLITPEP